MKYKPMKNQSPFADLRSPETFFIFIFPSSASMSRTLNPVSRMVAFFARDFLNTVPIRPFPRFPGTLHGRIDKKSAFVDLWGNFMMSSFGMKGGDSQRDVPSSVTTYYAVTSSGKFST